MKLLTIIFLMLSLNAISQDSVLYSTFPIKDGKIYYEKIIQIDSASKDQLFTRAKMWGLKNYNSQKDALQIDDKETGLVAYKGFFSQYYHYPKTAGVKLPPDNWEYWHIVKIFVKDNKAKITVSDLSIKTAPGFVDIETYEKEMKKAVRGASKKYIDSAIQSAKENFILADLKIKTMLATIETYLNGSVKQETDF